MGELVYEGEGVQLWNGDSRHLDFLPDESVSVIITSPPY